MNRNITAISRQRGVTLIELLIAIMIAALLAGISIPLYQDYIQTGEDSAMQTRVQGLQPFLENGFIENGVYQDGAYEPGGSNDFAGIGYSIPGDDDDIVMKVSACAGGSLATCYKIEAYRADGRTLTYEAGTYTFAN